MKVNSNCISFELDGSEVKVEFTGQFSYIWVENLGSSTIKMSRDPEIETQSSGVIQRPPNSSGGMAVNNSTIYISGTGTVNVMGTNSGANPFKIKTKGGDENTGANDHVVHFSSHNLLADYDVNTSICTKTQDGDTVTYSIEGYKNTGWYQIIKGATLKKGKMYKLTVDENYYGCGIIGLSMSYSNISVGEAAGNFKSSQNVISNGNTNTKYFYIDNNVDMYTDVYFGIWIQITVNVERFPYSFNIGLYEEI